MRKLLSHCAPCRHRLATSRRLQAHCLFWRWRLKGASLRADWVERNLFWQGATNVTLDLEKFGLIWDLDQGLSSLLQIWFMLNYSTPEILRSSRKLCIVGVARDDLALC